MKTGIKFMCRNSKSIFLPLVAVLFSSFVYAEDHIYPNGAFYNGGMVNGIRNGMGGLRTNDGTLTIGNWVGDRCDGIMLITEKNGNQYYSICKDGREVYKTAINASQFPGFPKNKNKLGWYMYGYSGHSDISFYEAASVKKSGSIVTYWALQDSIDPVNVKGEYFLSNIAKMQLDCSAEAFRALYVYWWSERQGKGSSTQEADFVALNHPDSRWHPIPPQSIEDTLRKYLCK